MIFRGSTESGHLRNEGHDFLRAGGALERASMTLRLLDVKYYVLLPETEVVGGHRDHYQWTSVLHALSGSRAYHHVYGGSYSPWQITDFLCSTASFRAACSIASTRSPIGSSASPTGMAAARSATGRSEDLVAALARTTSGEIFSEGLHEVIQRKLSQCHKLGFDIAEAYHFG